MEFEQLRQLDAVERTGTMLAAARELCISQPALSRSIQRLERELGQELFTRSGRRAELNEVGHVAVDWARQILRDERLMLDAVDAAGRRTRTLRVGTVAPAPLWHLTSLMVERFPQETLTSSTVAQADVTRGVLDGAFDLGIGMEEPHAPGLVALGLMRERLSVTFPPNHPLAAREHVTWDDLDGQTFLIFADIGFWRGLVERALPHATFIEQRDREVFSQLARSTPHCTFITDAPHNRGALSGRAVVPITEKDACATFYLMMRADAPERARQLFAWAAHVEGGAV